MPAETVHLPESMPSSHLQELAHHYNQLAPQRDHYRAKNPYYYSRLFQQYRFFIPEHKRVLEIGCGTGDLLNSLNPSSGVGVDLSEEMIKIARQKFPRLHFQVGGIAQLNREERFDFIVLSGLLGELEDIQGFLESLKPFCTADTRMIIEYYSYFWQYLLKIAEKFKWKIPQKIQNWITAQDINNFLALAGFEPVRMTRCLLIPKDLWGISPLLNRCLAPLPIINALTLNHFIIARPLIPAEEELSVSIVVPCRNEKGNLESLIQRLPRFGRSQEVIFVEGGSTDGTYEEAERLRQGCPQRDIKLFKQSGKGKGDAVRLGFSQAQGDVFMILDADLTVAPEDLPKFYEALRTNKGEFINGCRLIYQMEDEAMRFLNLAANKCFGIFFSWLLGQPLKDTLCGTKVLYRRHYEEMARQRSYFGDFDPFGDFDLIFGAAKMNLKMVELQIRY